MLKSIDKHWKVFDMKYIFLLSGLLVLQSCDQAITKKALDSKLPKQMVLTIGKIIPLWLKGNQGVFLSYKANYQAYKVR